jgi:hypothetical protein
MTVDEAAGWLQAGIAAVKQGERVKARELLQRVIEADENNLQGWLWLSDVVTTLEDREVCLENVLALDPANAAARKGLDWVRSQIAATPEIEPESSLARVEVEPALEDQLQVNFSDDEFNNSLLCVYCGHLTQEDDLKCPNCKRDLYQSFLKRERPQWVWVGWTVCFADAIFTLASLAILISGLSTGLSAAQLDVLANGSRADSSQVLLFYLGQANALPAEAQASILKVLPSSLFYFRIAYAVFNVILAIGLVSRRRVFHLLFIGSLAAAAMALYLTFTTSVPVTTGNLPQAQTLILGAIAGLLSFLTTLTGFIAVPLFLVRLALIFLLEEDFVKVTERLWSVIDRNVREASTAFVRAKDYMKRGMWTLAAMYLRRCLALQPTVANYWLALAESYAHLERYPQALSLLDQVERIQPNQPLAAQLRGVISKLQLRDQTARFPAAGEVNE